MQNILILFILILLYFILPRILGDYILIEGYLSVALCFLT